MSNSPGAGRGGARPGAGRKPTAVKFASKIAAAEKKVGDKLPLIADALIDLALGVKVEETELDGSTRVYQRPPDRASAQYLMDRIMGKPTERQEHSGPDGGPIEYSEIKDVPDSELDARIAALEGGEIPAPGREVEAAKSE